MTTVWYKYRWVQVQSSYIWCNENDVVVYYYICPSLGRLIRVDDCEEWHYPIFIVGLMWFAILVWYLIFKIIT